MDKVVKCTETCQFLQCSLPYVEYLESYLSFVTEFAMSCVLTFFLQKDIVGHVDI